MNTPNPTEMKLSAPNSANYDRPPRFTPRQERAIECLIAGPVMREHLDAYAGVSNGPMLVSQLRDKGLSIDCEEIRSIDRDGRPCWPGKYSLTYKGRMTLADWGLL